MSSVILFNGTEVSFAENITNGNGKTTTSQETAEYYARKSIASGEKDYAILENLGDSGNVTSFVFGFNAYPKTFAPSDFSHKASQDPLKPVCPVINTFFPL